MRERGLYIDHTMIYRWVQHYTPELEKRCRPHLNMTNDSWCVDETYIKVTTPHDYKSGASGMTQPTRPQAFAALASSKMFLLPLWSRSMTSPQIGHS